MATAVLVNNILYYVPVPYVLVEFEILILFLSVHRPITVHVSSLVKLVYKMADEVLFEFLHMELVAQIHRSAAKDEKVM